MCIGEKRTLTVPPEFGYGQRSVGPIPAGSVLSECPRPTPDLAPAVYRPLTTHFFGSLRDRADGH